MVRQTAPIFLGAGVGGAYGIEPNNPIENIYGNAAPMVAMAGNAVGGSGSGLAHQNQMPFLAINYYIVLRGIFPSRS